MKIHEVIYFTHELDLIEAHMEEHQHFVDKFFIKESPCLWTGPAKDLIFCDNRKRFDRFNCEVIVIPTTEFDLSIPASFPEEEFKKWFDIRRNNRVRSRTYKWEEICKGSDYVLSTDADEIIDSRRAHNLLELLPSKEYEHIAVKLQQHQFWVNAPGRKLSIYRVFRSDVPHRSKVKGFPRTTTTTIGWHFTNCYDPKGINFKARGITTHYGAHGIDNVPSTKQIAKDLKEDMNPFKTRWTRGELTRQPDSAKPGRLIPKDQRDWAPKFMRENPERFPWYE
jgi:hypothetical protein